MTIIIQQKNAKIVLESNRGPQGPRGFTGGGDGGGSSFTHTQSVASALWTIEHGLSAYPSVSVVDSAGDQVLGDVKWVSSTVVTVAFSAPFSGKAYLN